MYHDDIKQLALENTYFRDVLYTGRHSQLVVMSIEPGSDIGLETHPDTDQIIVIVEGEAEAKVGSEVFGADKHDVVFVPAGVEHNITNNGDKPLKLYTVYAPPEHTHGTVHKTKAEAQKAEE